MTIAEIVEHEAEKANHRYNHTKVSAYDCMVDLSHAVAKAVAVEVATAAMEDLLDCAKGSRHSSRVAALIESFTLALPSETET